MVLDLVGGLLYQNIISKFSLKHFVRLEQTRGWKSPLYLAQTCGIQARRDHQIVQSDLVEALNMMFLISSCTFTTFTALFCDNSTFDVYQELQVLIIQMLQTPP